MQSLERLSIDTPEQITLEVPLAGIGSRFLALTIDSLLQGVGFLALILVGVLVAYGSTGAAASGRFLSQTVVAIVLVCLPFCLSWGYFVAFETLWQGRTPGKRLAGIRVIHQSGRPMNAIECIGRNLMRAVDVLPGFYAVGLVSMMCSAQNRRLGDYVAGTIVVHEKALESVTPSWGDTPRSEPLPPELRQLSSDDLVLIETYLNRRYEVDPQVRSTTAQRIVTMVQAKTGLQKPSEQRDDDFLETTARQLRDRARFR